MASYILDTETTGVGDTPEIIEAALLKINNPADLLTSNPIASEWEQLFKPVQRIALGALAVHHILDEELINCAPSASFTLPGDMQYMIGHNIDYDWGVSGKKDIKRICTLALSRWVLPHLDSHSQSALYYHFYRDTASQDLRNAHSALIDVKNCLKVLQALMPLIQTKHGKAINTWEDLWEISEIARLPVIMAFGKHRGVAIADLSSDYKSWVLRQDNFDPYVKEAIKRSMQ